MENRFGQPGARPQVDVFGQPYDTNAVSYRHVQDGLYVAVPPFAARDDVEHAISNIKQWIIMQIEEEESHDAIDAESDGDSTYEL